MPTVAVVWRDPFTPCQQLQSLPEAVPYNDTLTYPWHISADGQTVVGWAADSSGNPKPVKWVGTTVTPLAAVAPATRATFCSPDASIILGDDGFTNSLVRWTSGGTAGVLLSPAAGQTGTSATFALPTSGGVSRLVRSFSNDGNTLTGTSTSSGHGKATKWVGVTPSALASTTPTGDADARGCSQDGSVVIGRDDLGRGVFWTGSTCRVLVKALGSSHEYVADACNGDGSVIWGVAADSSDVADRPCYWDSLATVASSRYGVQHFLPGLTAITGNNFTVPIVAWVAETAGSAIAVGSGPTSSAGTAYHGIRWNGTVPTDLGVLPGASVALAKGCSATGARVCGTGNDGSGGQWALYWDDANVLHKLPTLADAIAGSEGQGLGMSRDGSTIFGTVDIDDTGPVDPPDPTPAALSENLISLSVSYDRGHSFGSPVSQPMGNVGEYRKSLLWRRLGHGRDAVFQISWSTPVATALQGCWLEAEPGDGGQEKK
jgi:hypothetical protein